MTEYQLASPAYFPFDWAFLEGEAGESIIQNTLDVGVVFPRLTPRVEIHGVRLLRVQDDEGAVFVSACAKQFKQAIILKLTFVHVKE